MDDEGLTAFCADLSGDEVAIGAQSFAGIAIERLEEQFEMALKRKSSHAND